jgi:tRNA A-37 threonylcarbamoyl transferase component Bud32
VAKRNESFSLSPGRRIGRRYRVEHQLGAGSEGEVYRIQEDQTGVRRAAKLFYSHRDPDRRMSVRHARKLERLRDCPIVLQYHHTEEVTVRGYKTVALISELCEGEPLQHWIDRSRGARLPLFLALTLLRELAIGLEQIHALGEYHSDVHTENVLVRTRGIHLDLKLVDFYEWGHPTRAKMQEDVIQAVHVFYDSVGGAAWYPKLPAVAKGICRGLKRSLILRRFPTASALRLHLESFECDLADYGR